MEVLSANKSFYVKDVIAAITANMIFKALANMIYKALSVLKLKIVFLI